MDISFVAPIIIAIIAAIPGLLAFAVQLKKEYTDAGKVAQDAAISIIQPLRDEVKRLQEKIDRLEKDSRENEDKLEKFDEMTGRVVELEASVAEKDARIIELERVVSERDVQVSCLQAEIDSLRARLEVVEKRRKTKPLS